MKKIKGYSLLTQFSFDNNGSKHDYCRDKDYINFFLRIEENI